MAFLSEHIKLILILTIITNKQRSHDQLVGHRDIDSIYDFVVIGGGTAGPVVAARLSENRRFKVLLLEAGGSETLFNDIPTQRSGQRDFNWNYAIVPQQNAYFAYVNNSQDIQRGKGFGGSSATNSLNFYRGNPAIYDKWELVYGAKGWSYEKCLPYFLKSENNTDKRLIRESNGMHSAGGPLTVSTETSPDVMIKRYIEAANRLGYPTVDSDGINPLGVTVMQKTVKDGLRETSSTAFLEPIIANRPNLHIYGYTRVTKILFDDNKNAIGVQYYRNGVFGKVNARREVILSAGSISSPQILMLSGIGPKEHLQQFNITVISDLRVGDNLHGLVAAAIEFDIKNQSEIPKPDMSVNNLYKIYVNKSGPLSYKTSAIHQFKSNFDEFADIPTSLVMPRLSFLSDNINSVVGNQYKLKNDWKKYYEPYLNRSQFSLNAYIQFPRERNGTVRLSSTNPFENPIIDPKLFTNSHDLELIIDTFKSALKIYQSEYFKQFVSVYKNPIPGCTPCEEKYFCDFYLRCVAQTKTGNLYPVGTCRMGSKDDNNAVVDEKLNVKGVNRLRVVDSSVFPLYIIQQYATTVMIGERGAQFINDKWRKLWIY